MTGKVGQDSSYIYTYNLQNRLSTATITRTEGTQLVDITSNYVYNLSGIRVGANTSTKIDGGAPDVKTTTYLTDPANFTGYSQVLEETVNGALAKSYTLGDDVLAQTSNGTTSYLQYDGHGSTRLLTSASSAVSARFDYDAYGKNLFSANVTSPAATDMLYSGEQFDPNLQMQYLRARYYDQNNGRFNRLDPFGGKNHDPQSLHKYAYAHCEPVMGVDPSGNMTVTEVLSVSFITSVLANLVIRAVIPNQSKISQPDNYVGFFSAVSAGLSIFKLNGALMTLIGLRSKKIYSFNLYWLDVSLKIPIGAVGLLGLGGLLMACEMAASALTSPALSSISDFFINTMDNLGESLISDAIHVSASMGLGGVYGYSNTVGEFAGLAFGFDFGFPVKGISLGAGSGLTWGYDVQGKQFNSAFSTAFGPSIGKSAPGFATGLDKEVSGVVCVAIPTNMPDWSIENDL